MSKKSRFKCTKTGNSLIWRTSQCQADSHISHNKYTKQDRRSLYKINTRPHYTAALMIYIYIYCICTHFLSALLNVRWQEAGWMQEECCKKKRNLNIEQLNVKRHHLQRNAQSLKKTDLRAYMRWEKKQPLFFFKYLNLQESFYIL